MPTRPPSKQNISKQSTIQLTARDRAVLIGLFEARVFTLKQLAKLYFDDRYEMTKKRLGRLKSSGYVRALPGRPFQPEALVLGREGFLAIRRAPQLSRYPEIPWKTFYKRTRIAEQTLRHELVVSDVRVAILLAIHDRTDLELIEFSTWPSLISFEARIPSKRDGLTFQKTITVKPDGFLHLREHFPDRAPRDLHFYLEVDRSTESQRVLTEKILAYQDHLAHNKRFELLLVLNSHRRHASTSLANSSRRWILPLTLTKQLQLTPL